MYAIHGTALFVATVLHDFNVPHRVLVNDVEPGTVYGTGTATMLGLDHFTVGEVMATATGQAAIASIHCLLLSFNAVDRTGEHIATFMLFFGRAKRTTMERGYVSAKSHVLAISAASGSACTPVLPFANIAINGTSKIVAAGNVIQVRAHSSSYNGGSPDARIQLEVKFTCRSIDLGNGHGACAR